MRAGAVAWHDVECASYAADLPLWRELAEESAGAVLDIGCGTGRVALDLAALGFELTALDSDSALVRELAARAGERGLRVRTVAGDARSLALGRTFRLIIAPMQVVQLMGGRAGRRAMLEAARGHLEPGGNLAVALSDPFEAVAPDDALPPLPDVREDDGWVLTSMPVAVRPERHGVTIERLRQLVSPSGELSEELYSVRLDSVSPEQLEREAAEAGLRPAGRRAVGSTPDHVGSTVVLLEVAQ